MERERERQKWGTVYQDRIITAMHCFGRSSYYKCHAGSTGHNDGLCRNCRMVIFTKMWEGNSPGKCLGVIEKKKAPKLISLFCLHDMIMVIGVTWQWGSLQSHIILGSLTSTLLISKEILNTFLCLSAYFNNRRRDKKSAISMRKYETFPTMVMANHIRGIFCVFCILNIKFINIMAGSLASSLQVSRNVNLTNN